MNVSYFKIWSLNVNQRGDLAGLLLLLQEKKPDLVLLQEVTLSSDELNTLVMRFGYRGSTSLSLDRGHGVGVLHQVHLPVIEVLPLDPGALLLVRLEGGLSLLNIYAPSGNSFKADRRIFFSETVLRNLRLRENLPLLLGDFNSVIDRKDTMENYRNKNCDSLLDLVNLFGYRDGFRILHPLEIQFTFSKAGFSPSRLDRVYVPDPWGPKLRSVVHSATLSDHKCLEVVLEVVEGVPVVQDLPPRPYWKLNNKVLLEDDFQENFLRVWNKLLERRGDEDFVSDWWDLVAKPGLQVFLRRYSIQRARRRRDTKTYLFMLLDLATNDQDWEQVAILRSRIRSMVQEDVEGFRIRSRTRENVEAETGSLYHVNREVKRGDNTNFRELMVDGTLVQDKDRVEEEIINFFQTLFNGNHRSVEGEPDPVDTGVPFQPDFQNLGEFLQDVGQVPEEEKEELENPLSLEEVEMAIKTCAPTGPPQVWYSEESLVWMA